MGSRIALLRGINVGGRKKVPMAELRALAESLGLAQPRTYIASGNLLFDSDLPQAELEAELEKAIETRFGFPSAVMVRSGGDWACLCDANPFTDECRDKPNLAMVYLGKELPREEHIEPLRAKAGPNEKVEIAGGAVWIWFGDGGRSSKIDNGPKGIWTARNWRTVATLRELMGA
jgi:uncharacterized protein (DUF1697 family)